MCLIGSLRYRDSTSNTYNAFKCLKLRDIIKFKTCTHIFKADRNLLPPKLMERYRYVKHVHNYNTRNCGNIYQNIPKTFQKSGCPSIIGVKLYNQIPSHVRLLPSIISFKKRLKEFLTKYKQEESARERALCQLTECFWFVMVIMRGKHNYQGKGCTEIQ